MGLAYFSFSLWMKPLTLVGSGCRFFLGVSAPESCPERYTLEETPRVDLSLRGLRASL